MRSQKKATQEQRRRWREWLANGQVVRVHELPNQLTGYPSVERALAAVEDARKNGFTAEIVVVPQT